MRIKIWGVCKDNEEDGNYLEDFRGISSTLILVKKLIKTKILKDTNSAKIKELSKD